MLWNDYKKLIQLALAVLFAAGLEFFVFDSMLSLDAKLNDVFVRQHASQLEPDTGIVIIDIDEYSLERMANVDEIRAGRYPWPRGIHAELLEGILPQKPKAIVYDILFGDRDDILRANSDAYFDEVIQASTNIYFPVFRLPAENDIGSDIELDRFGTALGFTKTDQAEPHARVALKLPLASIIDTGRLGVINYKEDPDGIGRRYFLYVDAYGWQIPSLPARLARDLGYKIPDQQYLTLHWRGKEHSFKRISFFDLYYDIGRQHKLRPADELQDKIVIIGGTATFLGDLRATPLASLYPGVEILATAIDNLKNQRYMSAPHMAFPVLLTLLLVTSLLFTFRYSRNPTRIFLGYAAFSLVLLLSAHIAVRELLLLPVFRPIAFGWLFYALAALNEYINEKRTRERSMEMFGRFVDPRVVKDLVTEGEAGLAKYFNPQRIPMTVLFSDIRGFTSMSEKRQPEEIVKLLNRYFSLQTQVIFDHGGTMDKFIGDAIMAFWGAPVADKKHAQHAVEAALDMIQSLQEFKQELGGELGEIFDIGIGIHSGEAVVGMIGSNNKLDYTCIGDTVNTASRLEGQTKGRAKILVSAATKAMCDDTITFLDHGAVSVKGRDQQVQLFEPRYRRQE